MPSRTRHRYRETDCLVVGCGALGLMTALEVVTKHKCKVTVLTPADKGGVIPNRDTLRNHAWLQSGLLYDDQRVPSARRMRPAGLMMLRFVGVRPPTERGIFRFRDGVEAEKFLAQASRLKLRNSVEDVADFAARKQLGELYEKGFQHFWVPDAPFSESSVLDAAQRIAIDSGVEFLPREARIIKTTTIRSGYAIDTGHETIVAQSTILCAGAGLPGLLNSLSITHPLKTYRSALIRIYNTHTVQVPLFVDRSSHLSVIRHSSDIVPPTGCLVVGGAHRELLESDLTRRVPAKEKLAVFNSLPEPLRTSASHSPATAGHKTEAGSVEPWISTFEEYPGLIAAVPGKATLAYWTAQQISERIKDPARYPGKPEHRTDWGPKHQMHHLYTDVDETE